jgi:methionine synthase II (cobalamin-independent)
MHQKGTEGLHNTEKENYSALPIQSNQIGSYSIADELTKLIKLKEQGVLNEEEFLRIKKDLVGREVK